MTDDPPQALRRLWSSPWFGLLLAIVIGIAWLVVEAATLGADETIGSKVLSAVLSGVVGGLAALLVQLYGRLTTTVEQFGRFETLVGTLNDSVQDFHRLEERLLPSLYVSPGMKSLHTELLEWRRHVSSRSDRRVSPLEDDAWRALADAYFEGERVRVQSKTFKTTSDQFTTLVNEITQTLVDSFTDRGAPAPATPLLRVHITGMLPEEFYNGPQIEYTRAGSEPLFFCHRWEDYPVLYGNEYRADPHTQIRRYLLVRHRDFQRPELSALSTDGDLEAQARLVIGGSAVRSLSHDLHREPLPVLQRLLRKSDSGGNGLASELRSSRELIRSIHGYDRYGYWPIADVASIDPAGDERSWQPLLSFFARDYHGAAPEEALYCVLDEDAWAVCQRDDQLRTCFDAGWTPEVALFGSCQPGSSSMFWHFGILGLWRPFTRDMQLRFLTGFDAANLHGALRRMSGACRTSGRLVSLVDPNR